MKNLLNEKFWTNNPCILITKFCKFNPFVISTLSSTLNSWTRLVIIVTIILFVITKSVKYICLGIFLIFIIIIIYYIGKSKNMDNYEDCTTYTPYTNQCITTPVDINNIEGVKCTELEPCQNYVPNTNNCISKNNPLGNSLPGLKCNKSNTLSQKELDLIEYDIKKFDNLFNNVPSRIFDNTQNFIGN